MPSGAKKRKAAKRKKEKEASNSNNSTSIDSNDPQPRGNDDPKSQDERESDGGEVSSPASQDQHNNQHPFIEGNRESEKSGPSPIQSFIIENKPVEGITNDAEGSQKDRLGENVVNIDREFNSDWGVERKMVDIEHVESEKESCDVHDRISDSSSSDDKPAFEKKQEETPNSVSNVTPCNNAGKVIDSFSKEVTLLSENEKPFKENSIVETVPVVDSDLHMVPMSEVVKPVMEGAQVENPEVVDVVEPGLMKNEDKFFSKYDDVNEVPSSVVVSEKNEDKVFPVLDENVETSSYVGGSTANGNEGELLISSSACTVETSNGTEAIRDFGTSNGIVNGNKGRLSTSSCARITETSNDAENAKFSETSECTENRPLVPSAPQVAQRTSLFSCCGLLDVFAGSR